MSNQENAKALEQKENTQPQAGAGRAAVAENVEKLAKFGGFALLETTVEGAEKMNPKKRARKRIFLNESSKKEERNDLKRKLKLWHELLSSADNTADLIDKCNEKAEAAAKLLTANLKETFKESYDLEQSYRTVALFFKNTEEEKIRNVAFLNATMEQLRDDDDRFINAVKTEFADTYDRLDLRQNYSLLVIPGYLGSGKILDKWAKVAHKNKVMLVTDFQHLDDVDGVVDEFSLADLASGDAYKSNVVMTCNWIVGREKYSDLGEDEEMFVPPSGALAGSIYRTTMSQVVAGKKFGSLSEVDGVKFLTRKTQIADMEKMGLVPMVNEYGKVMPYSAKTLFNGDNLGLQTYSVVRVFDWVSKVLMDFLNRRAFENFDSKVERDIRQQIVKFLDGIKGPGRLIEKFKIMRFGRDPKKKDRIFLDIHILPQFPGKTFLIKLDGTRGDDPDSEEAKARWAAEYEEQNA